MNAKRHGWRAINPNLVGGAAAVGAFLLTGSLLLPLSLVAIMAIGGFFGGKGLFKLAAGTK